MKDCTGFVEVLRDAYLEGNDKEVSNLSGLLVEHLGRKSVGAVGVDEFGVWVRFRTYDEEDSPQFFIVHEISHEMRWIPRGTFIMGESPFVGDPNYDPEAPLKAPRPQRVTITKGFWMGRYPVTTDQYLQFCRVNQLDCGPTLSFLEARGVSPHQQTTSRRFPVAHISEDEITSFCRWLSKELGLHVALPTEAQWEYAARGSDGRRFPWGNEPPSRERAWYMMVPSNARQPVGQKPAGRSPFGVEEMAGSVWERCSSISTSQMRGTPSSDGTVFRGGASICSGSSLRSANRWDINGSFREVGFSPTFRLGGFRIVIPSVQF